MPQRAPPKAYQVLLKTHKLTIFLTVRQSSTIATLKDEALSALTSPVLSSSSGAPRIPTTPDEDDTMMNEESGDAQVPRVASTNEFELCRAVKDKGKTSATLSGPAPVSYEILDPSTPIKGLLNQWETLYIQFRSEDGDLLPVEAYQPSLLDEEDEDPRRAPLPSESPVAIGKGKRKAPPE